MPFLTVPNAVLKYEVHPSTPAPELPLLVLIHGGNGSGDIFQNAAIALQDTFRVCFYDRRGFTRSALTGPQDYSTGSARLATDTDDVRALIEQLNKDTEFKNAFIFGNSSGAVVALETLTRHAGIIALCLAHETPAAHPRSDREAVMEVQRSIYDIYRKQGHIAAMAEFQKYVHADKDSGFGTGADPRENPYFMGNLLYWFEREVLGYIDHEFDLSTLRQEKMRLVLVNGKGSYHDSPQILCNEALERELGSEIVMFEGGHISYKVDPEKFAEDVKRTVKTRQG
jgi:acetyltransferase/esterase